MSERSDRASLPRSLSGSIDTAALALQWSEAPWDTAIYGKPVLQITKLEVVGSAATEDFAAFERLRDVSGSGLVSCRLAHNKLRESMLLEDAGFRFIEMLYMPELDALNDVQKLTSSLHVELATPSDLPAVLEIAASAFRNERLYIDPRLSPELSDKRYQNWARSSLSHPAQRLFLVWDGDLLVSFFVTENLQDGTCYWHLNAVASKLQGQGYGRLAWSAMIQHAVKAGADRVRSSIAARNYRVLNLYARLGFRFPPPWMTFHWVRSE